MGVETCVTLQYLFTRYPLNFYLLKVKKFHSDSVKNESAREKKTRGRGRQTPSPPCPACIGLTEYSFEILEVLSKVF